MNFSAYRFQSMLIGQKSYVNQIKITFKMNSTTAATIQSEIEDKLRINFQPKHLAVVNESWKHNVPKGSESHFKIVVVSDSFNNISLIQRHRMVNKLLSEELSTSVHALSIKAVTPAQWSSDSVMHSTPNCMGGDKSKVFEELKSIE